MTRFALILFISLFFASSKAPAKVSRCVYNSFKRALVKLKIKPKNDFDNAHDFFLHHHKRIKRLYKKLIYHDQTIVPDIDSIVTKLKNDEHHSLSEKENEFIKMVYQILSHEFKNPTPSLDIDLIRNLRQAQKKETLVSIDKVKKSSPIISKNSSPIFPKDLIGKSLSFQEMATFIYQSLDNEKLKEQFLSLLEGLNSKKPYIFESSRAAIKSSTYYPMEVWQGGLNFTAITDLIFESLFLFFKYEDDKIKFGLYFKEAIKLIKSKNKTILWSSKKLKGIHEVDLAIERFFNILISANTPSNHYWLNYLKLFKLMILKTDFFKIPKDVILKRRFLYAQSLHMRYILYQKNILSAKDLSALSRIGEHIWYIISRGSLGAFSTKSGRVLSQKVALKANRLEDPLSAFYQNVRGLTLADTTGVLMSYAIGHLIIEELSLQYITYKFEHNQDASFELMNKILKETKGNIVDFDESKPYHDFFMEVFKSNAKFKNQVKKDLERELENLSDQEIQSIQELLNKTR